MKYLYMLGVLLLLFGCTEVSQQEVVYKMPENYIPRSYVVESQPQHIEMYVIEEEPWIVIDYEREKALQEQREALDKYTVARKIAENEAKPSFAEEEEDRIEEYCKEWGFEKCMGIDMTCEEDGCHKVTVECDDDRYNPKTDVYNDCRSFEVVVEEEIDDDLTESLEKGCY